MNSSLVYGGVTKDPNSITNSRYLSELQQKKRDYIEETRKQRRNQILSLSRDLLLKSNEAQDQFIEEYKEGQSSERDNTLPIERFNEMDHLSRTIERMDFEREEREEDEDVEMCISFKGKKKAEVPKNPYFRERTTFLSKLLTFPEWMIAPPHDLDPDYWFVYSKPDGQRGFVVSTGSRTFFRDKNGILQFEFFSKLPGGGLDIDKGKTCILDCIFSSNLEVFYIMDVIIWKDSIMSVNPTEFRFFFIEDNILKDENITNITDENEYIFTAPKKHDCNVEGFTTVYKEDTQYLKDGLLFAHKEVEYISGSNSYLLLWKDQFTSLYYKETQNNGLPTENLECVLHLNEDNMLETLDNHVLGTYTNDYNFANDKSKKGTLYRVSISSISIDETVQDIEKAFKFHDLKIIKQSSSKRAVADNLSKIIFQYLVRTTPLTADNLLMALKEHENKIIKEESE